MTQNVCHLLLDHSAHHAHVDGDEDAAAALFVLEDEGPRV